MLRGGLRVQVMTEDDAAPVQEQLQRAVRDLWSMVQDSGEDFVIFMDRRRMGTRVQRLDSGQYSVSWETDEGPWTAFERTFDNPREAAFHAFQGPH